jgi:hypothetical protein
MEEEKYREAIRRIMAIGEIKRCQKCGALISDEKRDGYVKEVLKSIVMNLDILGESIKKETGVNSIEDLKKMGGISMYKAAMKAKGIAEKFFADMGAQKELVIACLIYTIKPEFRDFYIEMIERISKLVGGGK